MRIRSVVIAGVTLGTLLVAGCSGSSDQSSPPAEASSAPASSDASSSAPQAPSASPSPSTASSEPSAAEPGSTKVSAADDALTWTMPCANPRDEAIQGNAQDRKHYSSFHGWACGTGKNTTAAVFLVQLVKKPANDDAAHRELQGAAEQVIEGSKPKHGTFQGHPSVSTEVTLNGRTAAFRGVSFDDYLVLFMARPSDNLDEILDTVEIKG